LKNDHFRKIGPKRQKPIQLTFFSIPESGKYGTFTEVTQNDTFQTLKTPNYFSSKTRFSDPKKIIICHTDVGA